MKTLFTKEFILENRGCYSKEQALQHLTKEEFTIEEILDFDVSLKDKGWFIRNKCKLTNDQLHEFAIGCALCVMPIYENKYPYNKAPREAIEAAKAYLAGTIDLTELKKKRAAADATDATYATYAAYDAAADDAYAAAAATYATYAAADDGKVDYRILLLTFFKEFVKTNWVVA